MSHLATTVLCVIVAVSLLQPPARLACARDFLAVAPATTASDNEPPVEYLPLSTPQGLRIREALEEETNVDFDKQPLVDVLDYLQAFHSQGGPKKYIKIQLDGKALEAAGLANDLPITIQAQGRLGPVLRFLLSQHGLAFVVVDDVLRVTTQDAAANTMLIRTYPVGDLAPDDDFGILGSMLATVIGPTNWIDNGGPGSIAIVPASRSLVVRQTYENHVQILSLLHSLRQARKLPFRAQVVAQASARPEQPVGELLAMIEAAQRAYEANERAYEAENTTLDELYIWSHRWMQAATEAAATPADRITVCQAHRDRMELLLRRTSALHQAEQRGGEDQKYYAAKFYLAEAELWLKKANEAAR